jgi:hypothetical protein
MFHRPLSKEVAMKRVLIVCMCIVLGSAMTARADLFGTFTNGTETVNLEYVRTASTVAGVDQINLNITGITSSPSGALVNGLMNAGVGNPTFTALDGGYMFIFDDHDPVDGSGLVFNSTASASAFKPGSFENFSDSPSGFSGTLKTGGVWTPPGKTVDPYSEWSATTGGSVNRGVGALVARIFMPTGGNFQLVGGISLTSGHVLMGSGQTPEPGTLALLATGLVGLLAYAWRKRK